MIGQHLILRCAKGAYDSTSVAGLKTAAVSENIGELTSARQQELNRVISEHAAFPDVSVRSGKGQNRGVLRMFEYRGVLMVMRTFRVHDLCDTGGSVSFTHTYMIADDNAGADRQYILLHPESLCTLKCFDDYKKVAERTKGGLNSGNPVQVNAGLNMPDKKLPRIDVSIFEESGFDQETFAQMISAICQHVSGKGWVALLTPNVTEKSWDEYGGSPEGEKILAGVLALLPDCIARFFSAVAFWNDNPFGDVLKDYKFRILSGKHTEGLVDQEISLFNLQSGKINTDAQAGSFGRYLWEIKDKPEEIEKFHSFLETSFGKNVDKIAKMPALMDALTDMYKFTEGHMIDEQATLASFLLSIGTSVPMFPSIYKGVAMLIFSIRESGKACSDKLESVIMTLLKNPETQKMKVCYENMIALLLHSTKLGAAKEKTIAMITEQLGDIDAIEYHEQFEKLFDELKADAKVKPSYSMLSLLLDAQDLPTLSSKKENISAILEKSYTNALARKDYDLCARMTARQLRKDLSAERVAELCKRVMEVSEFCKPEMSSGLVNSIGDQMIRFESDDKAIVTIGKAIFGSETEAKIATSPDYFPLFMRILRHGIIAERDYIETTWMKQFIWVLKNTQGDAYLFPEEHLGDPSLPAYDDALFLLEIARLTADVGYDSSWPVIEAVVSGLLYENPEKAYENIQNILDCNKPDRKTELLTEIVGTVRMYGLFLALYDPETHKADYLLNYIMQDMNAFDMLIASAESEGFIKKLPPAYLYVWTAVYSAFASQMLENCWIGIIDTENKVIEKPYCDEIMSKFAEYFKVVFEDVSKVPEIREDYIALMYRGIIDYGWGKELGLNLQQTDIIEMCYMIDNGGAEESVDYFLESIQLFVAAGRNVHGRAENLGLCAKRINRYLNNNRRRIMDDHQSISRDKIAILSLARMYGQKHDEAHSLFYLKGICEGDDHWMASLYVLYALQYLYVTEPNEESEFILEFLDRLRRIIINASGAGRNMLVSPECQDIYHGLIQPHLYADQQKPIFTAAKSTGNPDLTAMFEVNATKERPKSGFFGAFKRR